MRVFVSGIGVITSLGNNTNENLKQLVAQQHGIQSFSHDIDPYLQSLPIAKVPVTNSELGNINKCSINLPRTALLSLHAAKEAISNSGIDFNKYKSGFISATTVGGMDLTEKFFANYIHDINSGNINLVKTHACGKVTDLVASLLDVNTFVSTVNTACSSSANSIILASRLIKEGILDVAIAGGADALTSFTLNGFNILMLLDNDLCKPFDAHRKGLNLGEGAGYVVLVSDKLVDKGNCPVLCQLSGYANTTDVFHQTALSSNGDGPFRAMQKAINMAKISNNDVSYINLHGTATPNNDVAEGTAIEKLFGNKIPISSTKSYTGHTLGASGGIEAVFSILALQQQMLFPNLRFENQMPEITIKPVTNFQKANLQHILSNSFGFGGNCSSLLFSKV